MLFTITYSDAFEGWPSFYSYYPDWMLGMNNYFYTWRGGDLYQHNDSLQLRNTFYYDYWVKKGQPGNAFTPSSIESVFNQTVLENSLFKTIDLQGDSPWSVQLTTDIQNSGYIDKSWFEKKEGTYFAFIRNNTNGQLSLRSMNGVGVSVSVTGLANQVNFSTSPLLVIDSIVSAGDYLYFIDYPTSNIPVLAGQITLVIRNYTSNPPVNAIKINTAIPGTSPILSQTYNYLYVKNSVAESHGVLGHYCTFTMQNSDTSKIELFSVEADVMKSYP